MTWVLVGSICLGILVFLGQLRVWRTEKIRLHCIDLAITSRTLGVRAYVHSEKNEVIIERATAFENYVRGIKPKERTPTPPPPSRIDRLGEGNV